MSVAAVVVVVAAAVSGVVVVARQIAACFGVDVEPIGEVDQCWLSDVALQIVSIPF